MVCRSNKLTGVAAESRSEHHIPLSTSSLGSRKSAGTGARWSARLITQQSVKCPSARFIQLEAKSDFFAAEVRSYIITAYSEMINYSVALSHHSVNRQTVCFGFFSLNFVGCLRVSQRRRMLGAGRTTETFSGELDPS